jgi:hypothetical protein
MTLAGLATKMCGKRKTVYMCFSLNIRQNAGWLTEKLKKFKI